MFCYDDSFRVLLFNFHNLYCAICRNCKFTIDNFH